MREMTYADAAREALAAAMARDDSIFVLGEGIGARGGNFNTTTGLFDLHGPERLRDTPIAERGFTGLATGAAMVGGRPVVDYMFFDFGLDALGELLNQTSKIQYMSDGRLKMPILLRGCIGVGNSAATHHSGSYYPFFMHIPGFRVVVPATPADAKGLMTTALRADDPVIFMEHRSLIPMRGPVPEGDYAVPFGKGRIARAGESVTVVAISAMVHKVMAVAEGLAHEGISVEIVDPRSLAPLDTPLILESVKKTGRLLIVEETYGPCGAGAEIAARITDLGFDDLDAPIRRVNGAHTPIPYSPTLEAAVVPTAGDIEREIRRLVAE